MNFLLPFFIVLLSFSSLQVQAQIYKWKDENGKWHFSDTPKEQKGTLRLKGKNHQKVEPEDRSSSTLTDKDLLTHLETRFKPSTTVERVTLAVVGIETHLGTGSGFFVSNEGHIVTNRHVIRPGSTDAWQQGQDQMKAGKARLKAYQDRLDQEKQSLADYATKLKRYKQEVDRKSAGSAKSAAQAEYEGYEKRYQERLENHQTQQKAHKKRLREFEEQYSELALKGSMAGAARQFKVFLKDNTELSALLIKISADHDLALLQLRGYQTPSLDLVDRSGLHQGIEVFAVGSPLGMRDAVTSGIITSLKKNYLVTDAQILPGNSGGPLLRLDDGAVLGVNTLKFSQGSALSDGFGFAIPSELVEEEFGQYLP